MESKKGYLQHELKRGRLPPEVENGNIEYKLKLNPSPQRLQNLITQLKWRLTEGSGEALYEIGISDKGFFVGLDERSMKTSLDTLANMAKVLSLEMKILLKKSTKPGLEIAEVLLRKRDKQDFSEIRVVVLGAADAGKSSFIARLCHEQQDNGKGLARLNLLRHRHEIESGRSSAIAREILGYTADGKVINYANNTWEQIVESAKKLVTFFDTCGHEKYQKTTINGLTGNAPDYACLVLDASLGSLPEVFCEQLQLSLHLKLPIMIAISKLDVSSADQLARSVVKLLSLLKSPAISRTPVVIQSAKDLDIAAPLFIKSVTGENSSLLRSFFRLLEPIMNPIASSTSITDNIFFTLQEVFNVGGKTVVGGLLNEGIIRAPVILYLGPCQGKFIPILIYSVYRQRCAVSNLLAAQVGSLGLLFLKKYQDIDSLTKTATEMLMDIREELWQPEIPKDFKIRRGQVIVKNHRAVLQFNELKLDLLVISHPASIQIGHRITLHCNSITQAARVIDIALKGPSSSEIMTCLNLDFSNEMSCNTLVDSLNVVSRDTESGSKISSSSKKKRRRISKGIALSRGERGIVTLRLLIEPEVLSSYSSSESNLNSSVILRGADIKGVGDIISSKFL